MSQLSILKAAPRCSVDGAGSSWCSHTVEAKLIRPASLRRACPLRPRTSCSDVVGRVSVCKTSLPKCRELGPGPPLPSSKLRDSPDSTVAVAQGHSQSKLASKKRSITEDAPQGKVAATALGVRSVSPSPFRVRPAGYDCKRRAVASAVWAAKLGAENAIRLVSARLPQSAVVNQQSS